MGVRRQCSTDEIVDGGDRLNPGKTSATMSIRFGVLFSTSRFSPRRSAVLGSVHTNIRFHTHTASFDLMPHPVRFY
jgi:hypothetical protein